MGTSKSALLIEGETFLQRILRACEVFEETVVVTRDETLNSLGHRTILEDAAAPRAAITGIRSALTDADGADCFVIATDYPLVDATTLRFLRDRFEASSGDVLLPKWHGELQPLCAGYRPSVLPVIKRLSAANEFRVLRLIDEVNAEITEERELRSVATGEPLWNVNDRYDLQKLQEYLHER